MPLVPVSRASVLGSGLLDAQLPHTHGFCQDWVRSLAFKTALRDAGLVHPA